VNHSTTTIAFALLFAAGSALAQSKPSARATLPDPALDALVSAAIENTPELIGAHAAVEAARRRVEPARTLGDPSLSTTYQNDGRSLSLGKAAGSFFGLMLSQPLPWPGKLALAGRTAASEALEIESGTLGRAGLTIEARIRNAWYDLVLVRAIDHPNLRTMIDCSAAGQTETESIPELIARWLPSGLIAHLQVNDPNRRGPGQGDMKFAPILAALKRHHYAGTIAVEPFDYSPDGPGVAAFSAGYLRGLIEALD